MEYRVLFLNNLYVEDVVFGSVMCGVIITAGICAFVSGIKHNSPMLLVGIFFILLFILNFASVVSETGALSKERREEWKRRV